MTARGVESVTEEMGELEIEAGVKEGGKVEEARYV